MPKTSNPDRQRGGSKRGDRRDREPSEFAETTLSVDRVTRVVKGGRRMRFRAVVIVGNRKGKVGLGTGKANEVQPAVQKAVKDAKRHMVIVPITKGTIPHEVKVKFKAAKILLMPASEGTGIIAGGALRAVLDHAGVKNVLSKRFGTGNKLVNAQAVMIALAQLKPLRTKVIEEEKAAAEKAATDKAAPEVKTMSRKDAEQASKRTGMGGE